MTEQTILEEEESESRLRLYVHQGPPECTIPLTVRGPINQVYRQLYKFATGTSVQRPRKQTYELGSLDESLSKDMGGYGLSLQYQTRIIGISHNNTFISRKGKESIDALSHFESLQRATSRRITRFHIGTPLVYITYEQKGKKRENKGIVTIRFFTDITKQLEQLVQEIDTGDEIINMETIKQAYEEYAKSDKVKRIV